jgi:4-amino-4-deoxychorismate synthase (2-amino-4-deoxychorismate-forming) component I
VKALRDTGGRRRSSTRSSQPCCSLHGISFPFDLIDLHAHNPARYPQLLQSTAHGRFDILFAFPGETLRLDPSGALTGPPEAGPGEGDFLAAFDRWWSSSSTRRDAPEGLPFTGGWFVYLGYELAAWIEPCLRLSPAGDVLPVAAATRYSTAIVRDHEKRTTHIVAEPGHDDRIAAIERDIIGLPLPDGQEREVLRLARIIEAPQERYLEAVERIHRYIHEGDVFQVNISRPWRITAREAVDAPALYRNLRLHNPAPYSGIARWGDAAVISSSPERLVRVRGRTVEMRPIAGTRPRSHSRITDSNRSAELLAHPKERAEHVMLIDLARNDLGRICTPGSVRVDEFMVLESYAHVHHIVSNVKGVLRADITPGQVLGAVFPGGTITGCPKVRCMEIIAELEGEARGAYTGSMGYINRDGDMDMNILIRSMTVLANQVQLRAGAGIVADSVPGAELEETRAKALGLLHALGIRET